jgi:hypothetical protein
MITSGCLYSGGRLRANVAADPTPSHWNGGFGFDSDGRLCIATGAVDAGDSYVKGFRLSPKGAIRGVNSAAVDHYIGPYSFSSTDQLAYQVAVNSRYADGTGFVASAAGRVTVINS